MIQLDKLLQRYIDTIQQTTSTPLHRGQSETSLAHIKEVLVYMQVNTATMEQGKFYRWLGFVQGVLAVNGYLNVKEEREATRPIFNPSGDKPTIGLTAIVIEGGLV